MGANGVRDGKRWSPAPAALATKVGVDPLEAPRFVAETGRGSFAQGQSRLSQRLGQRLDLPLEVEVALADIVEGRHVRCPTQHRFARRARRPGQQPENSREIPGRQETRCYLSDIDAVMQKRVEGC